MTSSEFLPALDRTHRAVTWLKGVLVASLVGPTLLLGYVSWSSYEDAIMSGQQRLGRLSQLIEEQSLRIVETNDVIAKGVETLVAGSDNPELRTRARSLHAALAAWTIRLPQLQSVWIWDDAGRPIATNLFADPPRSLDVSDREYFVHAKTATTAEWFVSAPLRSRATGELFFDFSRRRAATDGRFLGAISVSLRPKYFEEFFRDQVANEPGSALSLLRADGEIIARYPQAPGTATTRVGGSSPLLQAMTSGLTSGETRGPSTIDGTYRYVAFRRIGTLPLYAVATGSRAALLAPWRHANLTLAIFTLPLSIGLATVCWFAIRRVRSQHAIAQAHQKQYEQRLRAEAALRQAQKMDALGRLTGGVAHDFNNVLMVVQSSVAVARQLERVGQPVSKALAPIERAVKSGAQLTRQLLTVVRQQPLQTQSVELQQILPDIAALMDRTLGRSVQVAAEVGGSLFVTVDQAELELALINLCINSRDAMPDGGKIRIVARPAEPDRFAAGGERVCIAVTDTGEGISSDLLPRVIEPFFTTKALGKGTGLGLSQVHAFATQSGGELAIESEVGRGTSVYLFLPRSAPPELEREIDTEPLGSLNARILLLEDNHDIAEAIQEVLRNAQCTVELSRSAESAQAALARLHTFNAVLSDVNLQGRQTGIDLCRNLVAARPDLPVVLMTGYTDRLHEAEAAGFPVLPKPVAAEVLISALRRAMTNSQARCA